MSRLSMLRLHHQQISAQRWTRPDEVVKGLVAVQAQDFLGSLWAIGLRMKNATESLIEQAIADRTLVRSWPMRGTLHFVAPQDVRWMLKLLAPRIISGSAGVYRQAGVDKAIVSKGRKLLIKALQGGGQLTREELYNALQAGKIATGNQRGLHIIGWLAQEGLLCFGPRRGKQQTFVLMDEWLPAYTVRTREESLAELTTRYFTGHGPASLHDLAWWSGLKLAEVKEGLELAGSALHKEVIEGKPYWMSTQRVAARSSDMGYLLPAFDEFTIGYKDRNAFLDSAHARRARNGVSNPVIIVDGRIVGTWKRTLHKNKVVVEGTHFIAYDAAHALQEAMEKFSRFLSLPVEYRISSR